MADIAHTMPAVITALDGSTFGFERPGLQITPFDAGPHRSRDWLGYNLRAYDINPSLWQSGTTALQEWSAFWHHIEGGGGVGYIAESVSETHRDLVCGGIADGTQTTFPIPVVTPTSVTVFVGGVPQESSAYTVHSAANLASDNIAQCSNDSYSVADVGSRAVSTGASLDGLASEKVTPAGGANPSLHTTYITGVSVGDVYTAVTGVLATTSGENYRAIIAWLTGAYAYIDAPAGSDVSVVAGDWTPLYVTATAPATAAVAIIYAQCHEADPGTDPFYVDCFALCPGDYDRWHLPSQAPGLVEFATAPAAGARITATATGTRVSRCRFEPGSSWRVSSAGHAASRSIRAVEVVEV